MKLFNDFATAGSSGGYHSAIVTTFGIEFTAFEQVLAPQLAGAGATNVVLLTDPGMLALALSDGLAPPARAGLDYVVHTPQTAGGVFHPKIVFQVGRQGARVVIASANTTSAGLAGNLEVASLLECSGEPGPERAFAVAAWNYLIGMMDGARGPAADAVHWLETHTPWLAAADDDTAVRAWTLADDTRIGFFANEPGQNLSIAERFIAEAAVGPVEQLTVISPYWDDGLVALRDLIEALTPARTVVLIQPNERQFPKAALGALPVEIKTLHPAGPVGRFSHAKMIIATGGGYDHILSGSANCTVAALGRPGRAGVNAEACIYRRLPAGSAVAELMLAADLAGPAIAADALPALVERKDLPLEAAETASPGTFEFDGPLLTWRPSPSKGVEGRTVELLADPHRPALVTLAPEVWTGIPAALTTLVEGAAEGVRLARAIGPDGLGSLALIARRDALRSRRRERDTRATERVKTTLESLGDLDLEWPELLTQLEKADAAAEGAVAPARRTSGPERTEGPQTGPVSLGYDEFIKTRRRAATEAGGSIGQGAERNGLAGSNVDVMRAVFNSLIQGGISDDDLAREDMGGEGDEDGFPRGPPSSGGKVRKLAPPPAAKPPSLDPAQFEKAVGDYANKVRAQAKAGRIGPTHVFRLRCWMTVILRARDRLTLDESETGWPRLLVRALSAFFIGTDAPIRNLAVDPRYEQLPVDLIEAWSAALHALDELDTAMTALGARPGGSSLAPHVVKLAKDVRALIGLTPADLAAEPFTAARTALVDYLARPRAPRNG